MIKADKPMHFFVGFLIAFLVYPFIGVAATTFLIFVIAVAKEVLDYTRGQKHDVEFIDFLATLCGGLALIVLHHVLYGGVL